MERLYKYIEITDLKDMLKKSGEKYGEKIAYKIRQENGYKEITHNEVRKMVDRMITYGKKGTLVSRRKALAFLHNDKDVVAKVFNELAPKYADRNGGYTRIIKLKERVGDDALTVKLELV